MDHRGPRAGRPFGPREHPEDVLSGLQSLRHERRGAGLVALAVDRASELRALGRGPEAEGRGARRRRRPDGRRASRSRRLDRAGGSSAVTVGCVGSSWTPVGHETGSGGSSVRPRSRCEPMEVPRRSAIPDAGSVRRAVDGDQVLRSRRWPESGHPGRAVPSEATGVEVIDCDDRCRQRADSAPPEPCMPIVLRPIPAASRRTRPRRRRVRPRVRARRLAWSRPSYSPCDLFDEVAVCHSVLRTGSDGPRKLFPIRVGVVEIVVRRHRGRFDRELDFALRRTGCGGSSPGGGGDVEAVAVGADHVVVAARRRKVKVVAAARGIAGPSSPLPFVERPGQMGRVRFLRRRRRRSGIRLPQVLTVTHPVAGASHSHQSEWPALSTAADPRFARFAGRADVRLGHVDRQRVAEVGPVGEGVVRPGPPARPGRGRRARRRRRSRRRCRATRRCSERRESQDARNIHARSGIPCGQAFTWRRGSDRRSRPRSRRG